MRVLPVIKVRSLLVAAVVLACSATAAQAHVHLHDPDGGEVLEVCSVFTIEWHIVIQHNQLNWDLWYSTTGSGGPWTTIAMNLPAGSFAVGSLHTYDWTIPDAVDATVWVRVRMDNSGTDYYDVSNAPFSIVSPPPPCPADLNDDDVVGPTDLAMLLAAWGSCPEPCDPEPCDPGTCAPDMDGSCEVDPVDLAMLLAAWGDCP